MMIPTGKALKLATVWLLLAVVAVLVPPFQVAWLWLGAAAGLWLLGDGVWGWWLPGLEVKRRLPKRFAQGEYGEVRLEIVNVGGSIARVEVFDGVPQGAETEEMPWVGEVPAGREVKVFYQMKLADRGEADFGRMQVRRLSPGGLWKRRRRALSEERVKVYPNYEPVIRYALLAMQHRESMTGIVRRPRAGSSRDFHQLRDYREGDPLVQIDWKATSRRQMLISRDYQEQRDQSVVFLVDAGRRMRAVDGGIPQFDQVLNAVLLVSYLALRQGDQVAVKSFGGVDRWLPPVKGAHAMPVLLNHLYDYQTTNAPSDFTEAVEQLMVRQRRRSLVVVMTNLRGEDGKELLPAMRVLSSKHLVLLTSMREGVVRKAVSEPVGTFPEALRFLAADRYVRERREILAAMEEAGMLTLDCQASEFPAELANRYFDIKAAGRL